MGARIKEGGEGGRARKNIKGSGMGGGGTNGEPTSIGWKWKTRRSDSLKILGRHPILVEKRGLGSHQVSGTLIFDLEKGTSERKQKEAFWENHTIDSFSSFRGNQ